MSTQNVAIPMQTFPMSDPLAQPLSYAPTQSSLSASRSTTSQSNVGAVALHKRRVCGMTVRSWIILTFWILASALLAFYIYRVATEFKNAQEQPSTVISEVVYTNRTMPAVTVCNWNTEGPDPNFPAPCDFCKISFVECEIANQPCPPQIINKIKPVAIPDGTAMFYCYQFNYETKDVYIATGTGYSSSISLMFEVSQPPSSTEDARLGGQVTFHKQEVHPSVFNETNYILPWTEFTYNLKEVVTRLKEVEIPSYDVTTSAIGLAGSDLVPTTPGGVRFKVAFTFLSLNQEVIEQIPTYSRSNFLGDLAGMASLLLGLDFIKIARGIVALTKAKTKGLAPFATVFAS